MAKRPSENARAFKSMLGMPAVEEAHSRLLKNLSYPDLMNLARLYEKDVDELVLKLFRVPDEARCHNTNHLIVLHEPEIVQALLYERYLTVIRLFENLEKKPKFNATAYGQMLFGMISLHHFYLRASD